MTLTFESMNDRTNFVPVPLSVTAITGHAAQSAGRGGRKVKVRKPSAKLDLHFPSLYEIQSNVHIKKSLVPLISKKKYYFNTTSSCHVIFSGTRCWAKIIWESSLEVVRGSNLSLKKILEI